jgi:hypothetical protein
MNSTTVRMLMELVDTQALKQQGYVPMNKWGKDHWSMLGYLGTLAPDGEDIFPPRIRQKRSRHWKPEYGTRLHGYFDDKNNPALLLTDHDDWDCLHDMEAEGLVVRPSGASTTFGFTPKGHEFVSALNRHKSEGGHFYNFSMSDHYAAVVESVAASG